MTAPLPSQPPHYLPAHGVLSPAYDPPAPWRVAVSGTGTMQMLVADALLSQHQIPMRVSVYESGPPGLRPADATRAPGEARAADVLRRVLTDPRVDVTYAGRAPASPDPDPDAVLYVGAADRLPLRGVAATRHVYLGRPLGPATAAVVLGSARAAAALARTATDPFRRAKTPGLRDIHLVLDAATLHSPATAAALEALLDLDVNVVVDPTGVDTGHRGRTRPGCCLPRSLAALVALGERFASPDAVWMHVEFGWVPVQVIGRDAVKGVVLADGPDLRTVSAQLLVLGTGATYTIVVIPGREGAYVTRTGGTGPVPNGVVLPGEYLAVESGRYERDMLAARRVAGAVVQDALSGRLRRRRHGESTAAGPSREKVVVPLRRAGADGRVGGRGRRRTGRHPGAAAPTPASGTAR